MLEYVYVFASSFSLFCVCVSEGRWRVHQGGGEKRLIFVAFHRVGVLLCVSSVCVLALGWEGEGLGVRPRGARFGATATASAYLSYDAYPCVGGYLLPFANTRGR